MVFRGNVRPREGLDVGRDRRGGKDNGKGWAVSFAVMQHTGDGGRGSRSPCVGDGVPGRRGILCAEEPHGLTPETVLLIVQKVAPFSYR